MNDMGDVRTVLSGSVSVHHAQMYVVGLGDLPDLGACFHGQANGLCGAVVPGALHLITGMHTGDVGFAVEVHGTEPPLGQEWEEAVEVSFRPSGPVALTEWGGGDSWPLHLPATDHRVRYCGLRMDEGHDRDNRFDDEPEVDRYLLQFWPAPPAPDRVLRQTGALAAYWHRTVRELPPPTPEQLDEIERARQAEARPIADEQRARLDAETWGGRAPSARLRALVGGAAGVARPDRDLVDAIEAANPPTRRRLARWVTCRTMAEAGLTGVDWIDEALTAIDRGDPLPDAFDDPLVWQRLSTDERVPRTAVTAPTGDRDDFSQQALALPALLSAREGDPLRAALDALWAGAAAFGYGRTSVLFAEVRAAVPGEVGAGYGTGTGGVG